MVSLAGSAAAPSRGTVARIRAAHKARDAKALAAIVLRLSRAHRGVLRSVSVAEQMRREASAGNVADIEVWARAAGDRVRLAGRARTLLDGRLTEPLTGA